MPDFLLFEQSAAESPLGVFAAGDAELFRRQAKSPFGVGKNEHGDFHWTGEFAVSADDSNARRYDMVVFSLGLGRGLGAAVASVATLANRPR